MDSSSDTNVIHKVKNTAMIDQISEHSEDSFRPENPLVTESRIYQHFRNIFFGMPARLRMRRFLECTALVVITMAMLFMVLFIEMKRWIVVAADRAWRIALAITRVSRVAFRMSRPFAQECLRLACKVKRKLKRWFRHVWHFSVHMYNRFTDNGTPSVVRKTESDCVLSTVEDVSKLETLPLQLTTTQPFEVKGSSNDERDLNMNTIDEKSNTEDKCIKHDPIVPIKATTTEKIPNLSSSAPNCSPTNKQSTIIEEETQTPKLTNELSEPLMNIDNIETNRVTPFCADDGLLSKIIQPKQNNNEQIDIPYKQVKLSRSSDNKGISVNKVNATSTIDDNSPLKVNGKNKLKSKSFTDKTTTFGYEEIKIFNTNSEINKIAENHKSKISEISNCKIQHCDTTPIDSPIKKVSKNFKSNLSMISNNKKKTPVSASYLRPTIEKMSAFSMPGTMSANCIYQEITTDSTVISNYGKLNLQNKEIVFMYSFEIKKLYIKFCNIENINIKSLQDIATDKISIRTTRKTYNFTNLNNAKSWYYTIKAGMAMKGEAIQTLPPVSKPNDSFCNYEEQVSDYTVRIHVGKLKIDTGLHDLVFMYHPDGIYHPALLGCNIQIRLCDITNVQLSKPLTPETSDYNMEPVLHVITKDKKYIFSLLEGITKWYLYLMNYKLTRQIY